jgi:type I restriction enzyme S subunit
MREITLGEVCAPVERCEPGERFGDEFTYIDLSSVDQRTKSISNARTLNVADAPSRARQLVQAGDVLVSTVRPNLNAVAIVDERHHNSVASTGFCVLRPRTDLIDSRLLFARVQSPSFVRDLSSRATGASYPAVTDSVVKSMTIMLPTLDEQRRIATLLNEAIQHIADLEAVYAKALATTVDLRQSVLEAALRGEL